MTGSPEWPRCGGELVAAESHKVAVLVKARAMFDAGTLSVPEVCTALGVSESTWHRLNRQYGLRELAGDVLADIDQALRAAGASDATDLARVKESLDVELALGAVGVWKR